MALGRMGKWRVFIYENYYLVQTPAAMFAEQDQRGTENICVGCLKLLRSDWIVSKFNTFNCSILFSRMKEFLEEYCTAAK